MRRVSCQGICEAQLPSSPCRQHGTRPGQDFLGGRERGGCGRTLVNADNARKVGLSKSPSGYIEIHRVISQSQAFQHAAQNASNVVQIERHAITTQICGDITIRHRTKLKQPQRQIIPRLAN